jgi:hypothetical protein
MTREMYALVVMNHVCPCAHVCQDASGGGGTFAATRERTRFTRASSIVCPVSVNSLHISRHQSLVAVTAHAAHAIP